MTQLSREQLIEELERRIAVITQYPGVEEAKLDAQIFKFALAALAAEAQEPVAEVVSKFGDPEAFGERELKVLENIQKMPYGTKFYAAPQPVAAPELTVWYGPMPESNGKTNWTASLHRKGDPVKGFTIDRSEYPDRVRYEADRMRWLIGELPEEPDILEYDENKHSGYVSPKAQPVAVPDMDFDEFARSCDLKIAMCDPDYRHQAKIIWNACRAAMLNAEPVSQPYTLPSGWKLVPVEPTTNQWAAGMQAFGSGMDKVTRVYKAMLAAAPQEPTK